MRVLIAADIFPPESGGPATYCVTLANEFVKQGIDVKIVSLNSNSDTSKVTCPVYPVRFKNKLLRYKHYLWLLFKHARWADIVYAMGPVNAGLPALIAARLRGKKFIVKVVGDYAWEQGIQAGRIKESIDEFQKMQLTGKIKRLKDCERLVCKNADAVVVPSQYLKKIVMGWGLTESKITTIYNAASVQAVSPLPKTNEQWVVTVARLVPWKGVRALIEAISELKNEFPHLRLKVVGDGPEKAALEQFTMQKNAATFIEFVGNKTREETLRYIRTANVFVLNSSYEGLSNVLLEALALGCPVAASNVGGNPELIVPGKTGELFEFNNKEQIKEKIRTILNRSVIGATEPDKNFMRQFSLETMILQTREFLSL